MMMGAQVIFVAGGRHLIKTGTHTHHYARNNTCNITCFIRDGSADSPREQSHRGVASVDVWITPDASDGI